MSTILYYLACKPGFFCVFCFIKISHPIPLFTVVPIFHWFHLYGGQWRDPSIIKLMPIMASRRHVVKLFNQPSYRVHSMCLLMFKNTAKTLTSIHPNYFNVKKRLLSKTIIQLKNIVLLIYCRRWIEQHIYEIINDG